MGIDRNSQSRSVVIASGAALSEVFNFSAFANGIIVVPTAWTAANIGFKVCDTDSGTFVPLKDDEGAIIEITNVITNASYGYAIPDKVFGAKFVKLWSKNTASEADVNQSSARSLGVVVKG